MVAQHADMRAEALAQEVKTAKETLQVHLSSASGKGIPTKNETGFDKDDALKAVLDSKKKQRRQWYKLKADADIESRAASDRKHEAWKLKSEAQEGARLATQKMDQEKAIFEEENNGAATATAAVKSTASGDTSWPWEKRYMSGPKSKEEEKPWWA